MPIKLLNIGDKADMSKALGADETIKDPKVDYDDAVDHFEDDLDVPEDEAERKKQKTWDMIQNYPKVK